jgi:hypothetical protein
MRTGLLEICYMLIQKTKRYYSILILINLKSRTKMRIQKHEITDCYMFWYYNPLNKCWIPHGSLYGYKTERQAIEENGIILDKNGNIIDEKDFKDKEWKIVEIK